MREILESDLKPNSLVAFVTRDGVPAKLLNVVKQTNPKNVLLFLSGGNILGCDIHGRCWSVNNFDAKYTESSFLGYDVYVENKHTMYALVYRNPVDVEYSFATNIMYETPEEAALEKSKILTKEEAGCCKIVKIELEDF
jgi:hypothetical protein